MKKILSLSFLVVFVNFCSAQSLKFMDDAGNDINGTVHYEYGTAPVLNMTKFQVENLTSSNLTLNAKVEKVYVGYANSSLQVTYYAGGGAANGSVVGPQIINMSYDFNGNELNSNFRISPFTWMWTTGNDSAVWNVTIYNELNVNDSVSATIIWKEGVSTSVKKNIELTDFNVFPNPVIGNAFTISNLREGTEEVILYNVLGKEVKKYFLEIKEHTLSVDVSGLEAGVYYCSVKNSEGKLRTQKVIINSNIYR